MSFRLKIFLLCISVYILTLLVTCLIVTEDSYQSMLQNEVERCLSEQSGIYSNAVFYLITSQRQDQNKVGIDGYAQRLVDMFGVKGTGIELTNENLETIAANFEDRDIQGREEQKEALKGTRSYILKNLEGRHYLYISDLIQLDGQKMLITVTKDISHVDRQKTNLYLFFLEIGVIGMIIVAIITAFMSRFVTRRVELLTRTAESIASGSFSERVDVTGRDEIARLAVQFNTMASKVEEHIDQLQKESQRKQRFIDNLTHEMRTPLTSIIGYSEFLMTAKHDRETYFKSLNYIDSEGKRMLKLVNQLMDMILLRQNNFSMERVDVLPLLSEVAELLTAKSGKREVRIKVEGQESQVFMDRDMIKGVLINLVDNAINASNPDGTVFIGVKEANGNTCIYVSDQGKGMEASELEKVLEPFYRVDKSRSRKEGGLGLGLAICNEIVNAHGAKLEIESQNNMGTTVTILFENSIS